MYIDPKGESPTFVDHLAKNWTYACGLLRHSFRIKCLLFCSAVPLETCNMYLERGAIQ